jgi:hypothetical protein
MPNFTRLDPSRPDVAILIEAMLWARELVAARSWATSQEPVTEAWGADVLADPRARIRRQPRGYSDHGRRTAQKTLYRLIDEPWPVIEVACSKCDWKAAFNRKEVMALYGPEYPLPDLLNHLAKPGCSKIKSQWDRCGVYCVNRATWKVCCAVSIAPWPRPPRCARTRSRWPDRARLGTADRL